MCKTSVAPKQYRYSLHLEWGARPDKCTCCSKRLLLISDLGEIWIDRWTLATAPQGEEGQMKSEWRQTSTPPFPVEISFRSHLFLNLVSYNTSLTSPTLLKVGALTGLTFPIPLFLWHFLLENASKWPHTRRDSLLVTTGLMLIEIREGIRH